LRHERENYLMGRYPLARVTAGRSNDLPAFQRVIYVCCARRWIAPPEISSNTNPDAGLVNPRIPNIMGA
jgi:hypothetical protein